MEVESCAVAVDLVEKHVVRLAFFDQHVKAVAACFLRERLAGVVLDQAEEGFQRAGLKPEIDGDDEVVHAAGE
jgi:hypothetical protein